MENDEREAAYRDLAARLVINILSVYSAESSEHVAGAGATLVRTEAIRLERFSVTEFVEVLRRTLVHQITAQLEEAEHVVEQARFDADAVTVELTARLTTATAANDRAAEHEILRECEKSRLVVREQLDASARLADVISLRLDAFDQLAASLNAI